MSAPAPTPPAASNAAETYTPRGLRIATIVGAALAAILLVVSIIFGVQIGTSHSTLSDLRDQRDSLSQQADQLEEDAAEVRAEVVSIQSMKAAEQWCADMTADNRENLVDLLATYSAFGTEALDVVDEHCATMGSFAEAARTFFPSSGLSFTVDTCELVSASTARIAGTAALSDTTTFSEFSGLDLWVTVGLSTSSFTNDFTDSTTLKIEDVSSNGAAATWSADIAMSPASENATSCRVALQSWWLAE